MHTLIPRMTWSELLVLLIFLITLLLFAIAFVKGGGLAFVVRRLVARYPVLSADVRARRVPAVQVCLACGDVGKKDLRYDPIEKLVIVQCPVCMAAWGREPLVNAGKWSKPIQEE
jgi:hypothetical protein